MQLEDLILTYSTAMKRKYGCKVFRVGLSTGEICPNRANGGCIFCNPNTFRGNYQSDGNPISVQLSEGKKIIKTNSKAEKFIAYFQDETSTAGNPEKLEKMFHDALDDPEIVELVISTRPDYISNDILNILKSLKKPVQIEIGMQSMHDHSLQYLNRGHDFRSNREAIERLADYGINTGVHLIMGIPNETIKQMQETIQWVSSQKIIKEIKLHNLVIYHGTKLAELWKRGEVSQMSIAEYIDILCEIIPLIRKDIIISRLFTSNILHNDLTVTNLGGNKTKWMNQLKLKLIENNLSQGCYL